VSAASDHDAVVGPVPEGRDPDTYDRLRRRILWSIPTGLYVLGSRADQDRNLMTISWVTQLAMEPKIVGVGVETSSVTAGLISRSDVFALSILPRRERALVRRFVKPVRDIVVDEAAGAGTMQDEPVRLAPSGAPVLTASAAWIDCAVRHRLELGSHTLFAGEVTDAGLGAPGLAPDDADAEQALAEVLRMEDTRMSYGG
jgi:flavin reductase (DIM6/NTAB) family NADH-FMN oxidoreductase RutF